MSKRKKILCFSKMRYVFRNGMKTDFYVKTDIKNHDKMNT